MRYSAFAGRSRVDFGFTTRAFGLKPGSSAGFAAALEASCDPEVKELFADLTIGYGTQVHSDRIAEISPLKKCGLKRCDETDGFITLDPGVRLVVFSADCLPLFLYATAETPAVGIVHAGWRGTRLRIGRKAAALLMQKTGAGSESVHAVLGPSLCASCYEVGEEFKAYFPKTVSRDPKTGRLHFDLAAENVHELEEAGIPPSNILDLGYCTGCRGDLFYSYRHEGDRADRLISWISITNSK